MNLSRRRLFLLVGAAAVAPVVKPLAALAPVVPALKSSSVIWARGYAVRDWRYATRICNIDVSELRDL